MKKYLKPILIFIVLAGATFFMMSVDLPGTNHPGDPLPNLTVSDLALFNEGKAQFQTSEDAAEGLGPIFNNNACVNCHNNIAVGGGSAVFETRFARTANGVFDALTDLGGSLLQVQSIQGVNVGTQRCFFATEVVPPQANVVAKRRSIPLFGLGLVDVLPDQAFLNIAASQPPSIRGRAPMEFDPHSGQAKVSRFGWKSQEPTLFLFSGDAYLFEMGITNPDFPLEQCPNGPPNCPQVQICDPLPGLDDDGADVTKFFNFMRFLSPIGRGPIGSREISGEKLFKQIGCGICHVSTFTTPNDPSIPQGLRNVTFHPYSDFLLHNMGTLGDGIVQASLEASLANPLEMRTQPLWGVRFSNPLLHDGRASEFRGAIKAHDGQGAAARNAFNALSSTQQEDLLAFLRSL